MTDFGRILDKFQGVLNKITNSQNNQRLVTAVMSDLETIFWTCCNDFPGAVAIRHSYDTYKKMGQFDLQDARDSGIADLQPASTTRAASPTFPSTNFTADVHPQPTISPLNVHIFDQTHVNRPLPSTVTSTIPSPFSFLVSAGADIGSTSSHHIGNNRFRLNERLKKYGLNARNDFEYGGQQHAQRWRWSFFVGDHCIGRSEWYTRKDVAKEAAAGHALEWLDRYGYL
jgi:hypothetical protein